jgi:hypothetical protein
MDIIFWDTNLHRIAELRLFYHQQLVFSFSTNQQSATPLNSITLE